MPLSLPAELVEALWPGGQVADKPRWESRGAATFAARWQDREGAPVGEPFELGYHRGWSEVFAPDGTIAMAPNAVLSALPGNPDKAHYLSIETATGVRDVPLAALETAGLPGKPSTRHFPETRDASAIMFPVFAEHFHDRERFFGFVAALQSYIAAQAPFTSAGAGAKFGLVGYYWDGCPEGGWFATPFTPYDCGSRRPTPYHGSNERARDLLQRWFYKGRYGLVLVDSPFRGGAGGMAAYRCPAWATITNCEGERWEAVALHEVGHALGLADEYDHPIDPLPAWQDEPNVTDGAKAPADWLATDHGEPTATLAQQAMSGAADRYRGVVGSFAGAFYRPDYYRPCFSCLMRETRATFCPICCRAIAARLADA